MDYEDEGQDDNDLSRYEEEDDDDDYQDWNLGARRLNQRGYEIGKGSGEKINLKTISTNEWENDDIETVLSTISDPVFLKNIREAFDAIDGKPLNEYNVKTTFTKGIETTSLLDEIDTSAWDMKISAEDKVKFNYEQKVNNLNAAFKKSGFEIFINVNSKETFNFLKNNLKETFTPTKTINGYSYNGKQIIRRAKEKGYPFYFDLEKQAETIDLFIKHLEKNAGSAWAEFSNYYQVAVDNDTEPKEYIKNMREEQINLIDESKNSRDLKNKFRDFIEMEKEIKKVKLNQKVKLRLNVLKKSFMEYLRRLKNWAWKNKKKTGSVLFGLILATVGSVVSSIPMMRRIKNAGSKMAQIGKELKKLGEGFHKLATDPIGFFRLPFYIPMFVFTFLGVLFSWGARFFKIGLSWGKLIGGLIILSIGKLSIMIYDIYSMIANAIQNVAEETEKLIDTAEEEIYLASGREVPKEFLDNELKKYEEKMEKYEQEMEDYKIEKQAAEQENKERNAIYEEQLVKYRKEVENYKLQLRQQEEQNDKLKEIALEKEVEIKKLNLIIDDLSFQISEKQKDVDFWKTKFDTERDNFNNKLNSNNEKLKKEKENIKAENEEEKRKLEINLENKYKNLNLQEQKVFHHRISLLQDKLNLAIQARDELVKEKEEKEKEKQEVKTKDIINIKQPKPPTLPQKPKLVPTIKKPLKPEVPHKKMKLNERINKNPTWKNELAFWTLIPTLEILKIIPWLA